MSKVIHIPPSISLMLKRIEHYEDLMSKSTCDTEHICCSLVITELELIMEQLTEEET